MVDRKRIDPSIPIIIGICVLFVVLTAVITKGSKQPPTPVQNPSSTSTPGTEQFSSISSQSTTEGRRDLPGTITGTGQPSAPSLAGMYYSREQRPYGQIYEEQILLRDDHTFILHDVTRDGGLNGTWRLDGNQIAFNYGMLSSIGTIEGDTITVDLQSGTRKHYTKG